MTPTPAPAPEPIATRRHTAVVVAFFTGVGFVGYMADRSGAVAHATPAAGQLLQLYGSALVLEWAAVFFVWRGTRRHVSLIDLVGRSSRTSRNVLTDIVLAAAVAVSASVGVCLGLTCGYFGGWFDGLVMRVVDVWQAIPYLALALAVAVVLGPGIETLILVLALG